MSRDFASDHPYNLPPLSTSNKIAFAVIIAIIIAILAIFVVPGISSTAEERAIARLTPYHIAHLKEACKTRHEGYLDKIGERYVCRKFPQDVVQVY